ncbi:MAG: hypothetical protein HYX78_11555 [Armatimonadetes bacterium]|nr:hypothetical protein [Armatimonadota bacterium]
MRTRIVTSICVFATVALGLQCAGAAEKLFPEGLPGRRWTVFRADGFSAHVTGVIYRGGTTLPGMPLGGLGTGSMPLGTDGTLEYVNTIYNSHLVRGFTQSRDSAPTYRLPFLGIATGDETRVLSLKRLNGVQAVTDIDYWGHYPIADLEYDTGGPVHVSVRAWTPFYPGDPAESNIPGSVFEVRLSNPSDSTQKGTLAFSYSGPGGAQPAPTYVASAINGQPGIKYGGGEVDDKLVTVPKVGNGDLTGDPAFTLFFLGTINKTGTAPVRPVSWGWNLDNTPGDAPGHKSAIEIDCSTDRVNWATGIGASAMTAEGSFREHYAKPALICVRKRPGPINSTTEIYVNGVNQPISPASSSATPKIVVGDVQIGAGMCTSPSMVASEIAVYSRALGDDEASEVGCYLTRKYGLTTSYTSSAGKSPDAIDGLHSWFRADAIAGVRDGCPVDISNVRRRAVDGRFKGVNVECNRSGFELGYALGVVGREKVRFGGALGAEAAAWNAISSGLPEPAAEDGGSSAAVDFSLKPGESKTLRFVLAWYAPEWVSSAVPWWPTYTLGNPNLNKFGNRYINTYSERFTSAADVAEFLAKNHESLLSRILAWQQVIYAEDKLPGWLQDSLINVLAVLPQESLMMKIPDPNHWWGKDGFFCVTESLMSCPHTSCIANDEFGEWAVNLLFPELGLRKLSAFKHYQKKDTGQTPSTLGAGTEADRPWFDQQLTLDGQVYIHMVDRYRLSTGNDKVLDEWYPSVKAGLRFLYPLDEDGDGLPDCHHTNHYLDAWPMEGAAPHIGTYWLSTMLIAERMAKIQGDAAFAAECRAWYEKGSRTLQERLWNPEANSYLLFNDSRTGNKSDTVICDQLIGEMWARLHGFPGVLPSKNVKKVIATLDRLNVAATPYGIRLAARTDGGEDTTSGYSRLMVPSYSSLAVSTTMLASGDPYFEKLGLEIMRRTWHNIVIRQNFAWDQPVMVKIDGTRAWGLEYYHNPMLWVLPLAVLKQDVGTACSSGGFIDRVRTAGNNSVTEES